ncbi:MAG: hypothetical protein L6264_06785 [Weeksellaceae bacterium]|nr:hypothetical protein [Bacteroidota bacterium]MCG2780636.1 hypothetical protein [Weeksellaceae bacterium]
MAELKGVLKITGKLGGLSFYEMNGKIIARNPGGFDGEKILRDEKYVNVRKNASEFGRCSKFGGKLRRALHPFVKDFHDPILHGRVAKMVYDLMKLDPVSPKGERTVQLGLQHAESEKILEGFVWNTGDGKRCRYDYDKRTLFFDRLPERSTKVEVTLRFINPDEGQDWLEFVDAVFEVSLPCSEFFISEDVEFGSSYEGYLKFALIRFYDADGFLLRGKTAVVLG